MDQFLNEPDILDKLLNSKKCELSSEQVITLADKLLSCPLPFVDPVAPASSQNLTYPSQNSGAAKSTVGQDSDSLATRSKKGPGRPPKTPKSLDQSVGSLLPADSTSLLVVIIRMVNSLNTTLNSKIDSLIARNTALQDTIQHQEKYISQLEDRVNYCEYRLNELDCAANSSKLVISGEAVDTNQRDFGKNIIEGVCTKTDLTPASFEGVTIANFGKFNRKAILTIPNSNTIGLFF